MSKRPDFTSMEDAMRVSSFMENAEVGRWRMRHFTIDEQEVARSQFHAIHQAAGDVEGLAMRLKRTVPIGDYICLQRRATDDERQDIVDERIVDSYAPDDPDAQFVPIMSDTPSEIIEHAPALERAHGRVLITGLGLGVLVSALLAKPEVEHITVVEIDRDVIGLTGPYYDDPRVTIVNADALRFALVRPTNTGWVHPDRRYDFAWHDIWSHISARNLDDDKLAEHGISYKTMFEAYEPFVAEQGAWAYEEAQQMRMVQQREHQRAMAWSRAMLDGDTETRVRLIAEKIVHESVVGLPADAEIPAEIWDFYHSDHMKEMCGGQTPTDYARRVIEEDGFNFDKLADEVARDSYHDGDPMGRPNEVEGANVAR